MATMRIDDRTHGIIRSLAGSQSMQDVVQEAVEDLKRKRFFERMNAAYAAMQDDADSWAEEQQERAEWDTTIGDGLDEGE